jgi:hypothetical protein
MLVFLYLRPSTFPLSLSQVCLSGWVTARDSWLHPISCGWVPCESLGAWKTGVIAFVGAPCVCRLIPVWWTLFAVQPLSNIACNYLIGESRILQFHVSFFRVYISVLVFAFLLGVSLLLCKKKKGRCGLQAGYQVVIMESIIIWDVTPCSLVDVHKCPTSLLRFSSCILLVVCFV